MRAGADAAGRLVEIKLLDTEQAIRELTAFAVQLTGLSERLGEPPPAGACDDSCACNDDAAATRPRNVGFGRTRNNATAGTPVVCDVSSAPNTVEQRIASYRQLFADAFIDRQQTVAGNRFRFRADDGIEARVRRLADLEKQCCAFFTITITVVGGEVLWDTTVIDDDIAGAVLAEWFDLPETSGHGVRIVRDRMAARGLQFMAPRAGRT